jgi:hypothetical protein
MTEAEWLTKTDPKPMFELLGTKVSDRKLRLFGIACCRLSWDSFSDRQLRKAVELAEEYADGRLDESCRTAIERSMLDIYEQELAEEKEFTPTPVLRILTLLSRQKYDISEAIGCSSSVAYWAFGDDYETNYRPFEVELVAEHTQFVRDIFGHQAFRPITIEPSWLTSTVVSLAQQIYVSRDFSSMPILADALQDVGCDNEDILNHCRQPGEHVRGCWCVDLVLGKS